MKAEYNVYADKPALCMAAAQTWYELSAEAINSRGRFNVSLSGGTTPADLFAVLAGEPFFSRIDWQACHFYFGDERYVLHDHPDSNYAMARQHLFLPLDIPEQQIHPFDTTLPAAESARQYEQTLRGTLPLENDIPVFDLMLLGMGADGHTASLFPGTTALQEENRLCTAVEVPQLSATRLTMTYPVINQSRYIMLLVAGADKAERVAQVFANESSDEVPIQRIQSKETMHWYLDQQAASKLIE